VQVGTANVVVPFVWSTLLESLRHDIARHQLARIADVVGSIDTTSCADERIGD